MGGRTSMGVLAALVALAIALYLGSSRVVLNRFEALETEEAERNLDRVEEALDEQLDALLDIARDWGYWDDTYDFVANDTPEYIESNLEPTAFEVANFELIAYFAADAQLHFVRSVELATVEEVDVPEGFVAFMETNLPVLLPADDLRATRTGLLTLPDTTLAVAAVHVLRNDTTGPIAGYLVLGRYVDDDFVAELAETTHVDLAVTRVDSPARRAEGSGVGLRRPALTRGERTLTIETVVPNLLGAPGLSLRVSQRRAIYDQGRTTVRNLAVVLFALTACFGAFGIYALHRSRRALEESEARHRSVVEQAWDGIVLVEEGTGRIIESNEAFRKLLGYSSSRELEAIPFEQVAPDEEDPLRIHARRNNSRSAVTVGDQRYRRMDGTEMEVEASVTPVQVGKRDLVCVVVRDISERKRKWLWHYALHDPLTNLPNRILFNDRLELALAQARRGNNNLAVFFVDLDGFKAVNDSLGHAAGDALLQHVAERLKGALREGDTVARQGGDEFLLLLPNVGGRGDLTAIAERLLNALTAPFDIQQNHVLIGGSIGIAMFPDDAGSASELVRNADTAMYHVKQQGKRGYQLYQQSLRQVSSGHLGLRAYLAEALEQDLFTLLYQPIVEIATGRIVGTEALLRCRMPEGRLLAPGDFLPTAEAMGLMVPLGEWVLDTACAQLRTWLDAGLELRMAVNLSPHQLRSDELVERVREALAAHRLDGSQVELEITESSAMRNQETGIRILNALKQTGIRLALDDFGVGHSSFAHLRLLPVDTLKIDRNFLTQAPEVEADRTVLAGIVGLAGHLGMGVVAEGVETQKHLELLRELGCELAQGYYLCRPKTADELLPLLRSGVGAKSSPDPG